MLLRGRLRDRGDIEIDRIAAPNIHHPAVDQRHAEPLNPAPGGPIFKAPRTAGIGRDRAAQEGHRFGRIRRIKLVAGLGRGVEFVQGDAGADRGEAIVNVQPAELLHRDLPAAVRDPAPGQAAAPASDRDGDFGSVRLRQDGEQCGFIGRNQGLFGVALGAASVFK